MTTDKARTSAVSFGRDAMLMFAANVATLMVGYVASVVIRREIGPESAGLIANIQYGAVFAVTIFGVGVAPAAVYYASRRPRHRSALYGNGIVHAYVLAAVFVVLAWLLKDWLTARGPRGLDSNVWYLAALLVPLTQVDYLSSSLLFARRMFRRFNLLTIIGRTAMLVLAVVLLVWLHWGIAGALLATASASIAMFIGAAPVNLRDGVRLSWLVHRATLRYGARAEVGSLLQMVNARFDVFVLTLIGGLRVVGYYVVAQTVAELVLIVSRSVGAVLTPVVAADAGRDTLSAPAIRVNGTLSLLAAIVLGVVGPALLYAYGPQFRPAFVPFFIILPGIWFTSTGIVISQALRGLGRPGLASLLVGAAVTATVALDLALVPPYAATGGAIASTVAYTIFGVVSLIVFGRVTGTPPRDLLLARRDERQAFLRMVRARLGR